jgi:hypothetical protein
MEGEGWLSRLGGKRKWANQASFRENNPWLGFFIPKNLFHFTNSFSNSKIHLNSNQI